MLGHLLRRALIEHVGHPVHLNEVLDADLAVMRCQPGGHHVQDDLDGATWKDLLAQLLQLRGQ
eukprot:1925590-Pyramimonas_sp.AAC.1